MLSELQGEERHWLFTVTANLFTPPTQAYLLVSQTRTPELFIRTKWTCANGSVEEAGRGPCEVEKGSLHTPLDQEGKASVEGEETVRGAAIKCAN